MKKYERQIGLKTIALTFIRRFDILLIIFLPVLIGSFVATQFIMTKKYYSNIVVSKFSNTITSEQYQNIKLHCLDDGIVDTAVTNLSNNGIKHFNGTAITSNDIKNGMSFPKYVSSNSETLSFVSTDKTITKPVLTEVTTLVVELVKKSWSQLSDLHISSNATEASKDKTPLKYFLIASAAGLGVAFVTAFVYEIASDRLYDCSDIRNMEFSAVSFKLPKKKEDNKNVKNKEK
jgi:capsular polysaccharide biosynthesis protein